jgi:hypothetical protein
MQSITPAYEKGRHLTTTPKNELIFRTEAVEIRIIDRWGRPIWKKERGELLEPIRWGGLDLCGSKVETGSYTCKIVYPDNQIYYIPFIFIQR